MKAQLLVEFETRQVIAAAVDKGKTHDFKLLKRSRLPYVSSQLCLADRGYQGFAKRHAGACTLVTRSGESNPTNSIDKMQVETLDWVEHAVFYQIFPDRFAKGKQPHKRLLKSAAWEKWNDLPTLLSYKDGDRKVT